MNAVKFALHIGHRCDFNALRVPNRIFANPLQTQ